MPERTEAFSNVSVSHCTEDKLTLQASPSYPLTHSFISLSKLFQQYLRHIFIRSKTNDNDLKYNLRCLTY